MFGSTVDESGGGFRKTVYLSTKPGKYTIRILDAVETKKYAHFIKKGWIECLGEECPICANNKKILYEHPEDYKDDKGWCPRRARYFLNVLDRGDEVVKVLSCGPQLIEDLKVMSQSIRNEQDERIDIRLYDWDLIVKGEGRDKETTPSHKFFGKETKVEYNKEDLFDLDNCIIKLTASEMLDVYNGVSLKDIFAVRKAKVKSENSEEPAQSVLDEVNASVDEIFKS